MEKVLIVGVMGLVAGVVALGVYQANRECQVGHYEQQIEMPMGVVVGGSKYGGGVSVPMGNAKIKDVFVCDEYK